MARQIKLRALLVASIFLSGCSYTSKLLGPAESNVELVKGPPIEDVVTSFDDALTCLRGRIPSGITFAVGQVVDATGKETYADGGTGKFMTQGNGEMVQSALFRAGVSVVNRRDPQISIVEANWGIRDIKRQIPVNFYISGSVNSLDFIPGGGFTAQIGGVGPRVRQNRMLIALDLSITDAYTGRVVASIPLQKQIYTREIGGVTNSFFGTTLMQLDAGGMEREALHFALRQMLNFATFELLGQLMKETAYNECREKITSTDGFLTKMGTADRAAVEHAIRAMKEDPTVPNVSAMAVPVSQPAAATQPQQAGEASQNRRVAEPGANAQAGLSQKEHQAAFLAEKSTSAATEAIRLARISEGEEERSEAVKIAAQALSLSNMALKLLQKAAEFGFGGDEGEVAAVVVQQAIQAAQKAGTAAAARPLSEEVSPQNPEVRNPLSTVDEEQETEADDPAANVPPGGPVQDKRMINQ